MSALPLERLEVYWDDHDLFVTARRSDDDLSARIGNEALSPKLNPVAADVFAA